ncbi:MAG: fibrobacter succinogenes major paralogous domain-containing protein, partial [Bacteroidales bacterium]|nr:fibrobacter succinogenes major paralogous domain-containing protein [Bacteroidales bacterium]
YDVRLSAYGNDLMQGVGYVIQAVQIMLSRLGDHRIGMLNETEKVIITQTWMAENLKTTKYNDGTPIPLVTDNTEWMNIGFPNSPGYCWYNNDISNRNPYGALYWINNNGMLCPTGWHVPQGGDWSSLVMTIDQIYPDGKSFYELSPTAGGPLKETGTIHWEYPNTGATNKSGFTALPGGRRTMGGEFDLMGKYGVFLEGSYYQILLTTSSTLIEVSDMGNGIETVGVSVRCIRDN